MIITFELPGIWITWVLIVCGWTAVIGYGFLVALMLREIVSLQYRKIDQLLEFGELYAFAQAWKKKKDEDKLKEVVP